MTSISYNPGAAVALQMLGGTVQQKEEVQDDVATGKEVDTASDAAAIWAVSQMMEADLSAYSSVSDSLSLGEATVAVASAGAEQITDILSEMKELAVTAAGSNADHGAIEKQMAAKVEQIGSIIGAAGFNGVNLLKTDVDGNGGSSLTVASGVSGSGIDTLDVAGIDLEGSVSFDLAGRTAITDSTSALTALGEIEGFLDFAISGAASLGTAMNHLSAQDDMTGKLSDSIRSGISAMTDTSMEEAATRLKALQVQEQLGAMSLNIANSAPGRLSSLF